MAYPVRNLTIDAACASVAEPAVLQAENREVLIAAFPELREAFDALPEPLTTIVRDEDGQPVNIDLGGAMLYPMPAPAWVEDQLRAAADEADRLVFRDARHTNLSAVTVGFYNSLLPDMRAIAEAGFTLEGAPVKDIGYLFVFGIGLGLHLQRLVETTLAEVVVIAEPIVEFFTHSLSTTDWREIIATAERRNIRIEFILGGSPEDISERVENIVWHRGNTFLDGSYFYCHYVSWAIEKIYELLKQRLKYVYNSSGFFEDEVEMMRNCYRNLADWSCCLVETRAHLEQPCPVFILGAGPSIERDMPVIRRLRDKVVVVSCGTALGVLLKNGIRPDIHCEIERGALVYDILCKTHAEYGFEGITLLASTTVDPRIGDLFDKRWFYFRPGLSPTRLFNDGGGRLHGCDPLVCNAAFSAIATLGFTNIFLFGIDLGWKDSSRHHHRDSVYFKHGNEKYDSLYQQREDRSVPGNFGGNVRTFWAFDLGRHMLATALRSYNVKPVNCSGGARIEGATPKASAAIRLDGQFPSRQATLASVERQLRYAEPGGLLQEVDWPVMLAGFERIDSDLDALIDEARRADRGYRDFHARIKTFLLDGQDHHLGLLCLAHSSLESMVRIGAFFGSRFSDETAYRRFFENFLDRYRACCGSMTETARAFLEGLAEGDSSVATGIDELNAAG